jgi:hypothetical protein
MRIIRYHSTVRGEAPSAALAAQKKSVAAPIPMARTPPESSAIPETRSCPQTWCNSGQAVNQNGHRVILASLE